MATPAPDLRANKDSTNVGEEEGKSNNPPINTLMADQTVTLRLVTDDFLAAALEDAETEGSGKFHKKTDKLITNEATICR